MATLQIQPAETGPNAPPARDPNLPENFADVKTLAESYKEAQRKITELTTPKPGDAPKPPAPAPTPAPAPKVVEGVDFAAIAKEFVDTEGKLSDATKQLLTEKGVSEADISTYIAGVKSASDAIVSAITVVAGSADEVKKTYEWAAANMSKTEVDAYNKVTALGDLNATKIVFEALYAKYKAAVGTDGARINGEAIPTNGGNAGYASNAEVVAAMSDPRYKTDSAYRSQVAKRMENTDFYGPNR